jgi:hypothetical protein
MQGRLRIRIRSTCLFPRPIPFPGPTDGCNLVSVSPITLLEKVDCQNDKKWQNELDKWVGKVEKAVDNFRCFFVLL